MSTPDQVDMLIFPLSDRFRTLTDHGRFVRVSVADSNCSPGHKKTPNLVGGFKFQISFPHLMMIDKHFLGQLNSNNTVTALVFPKVESS